MHQAVPPRHGEPHPTTDQPQPIVLVIEEGMDGTPSDVIDTIDVLRTVLPYPVDIVPVHRCVIDDSLAHADPTSRWVQQLATLSKREREVLQELVDGYPFAEVADRLFVSRHTFRTHMKNILAKFDVHSSIEAVSIGVRAGMRPRAEMTDGPFGYERA